MKDIPLVVGQDHGEPVATYDFVEVLHLPDGDVEKHAVAVLVGLELLRGQAHPVGVDDAVRIDAVASGTLVGFEDFFFQDVVRENFMGIHGLSSPLRGLAMASTFARRDRVENSGRQHAVHHRESN